MSSPFSVIFCGTPEFAIPSLEALIASPEFSVDLVITQPDKPVGRKQIITAPPIKAVAQKHGIPVEQPENINDFKLPISNFQFLVTVAYGQIIKSNLLALPTIAPINVHPSLLPLLRGASPIQNALLTGDAITGVTIQHMTSELDAGGILGQKEVSIEAKETNETLHNKLAITAASLLVDTLRNPLKPQAQDSSKATFCKKLSREDGVVDPNLMTAQEIDRRVRALVPWPGVTCTINGEDVKIHETSLESTSSSFPMPCKDGTTLYINKIQSPGKNVITGNEWVLRRK